MLAPDKPLGPRAELRPRGPHSAALEPSEAPPKVLSLIAFGPSRPILASCSADFTLKIWVAHLAAKRGQETERSSIEGWHRPHGSM